MSILLEGSVTNKLDWQGKWMFLTQKEKKAFNFNYSWKSNLISSDLFEHVSFLSPQDLLMESQKNSRVKGKHQNSKPKVLPVAKAVSSSSLLEEKIPIPSHSPMNGSGSGSSSVSSKLSPPSSHSDQLHNDTLLLDQVFTNYENLNHSDKQLKEIDRKHPLFGVWEGDFEVNSLQSTTKIKEEFFFHSYVGLDSPEHLSQLPPEPNFTYSALGVNDETIRSFIKSVRDSEPNTFDASRESKDSKESNLEHDMFLSKEFIIKPSSNEDFVEKIVISNETRSSMDQIDSITNVSQSEYLKETNNSSNIQSTEINSLNQSSNTLHMMNKKELDIIMVWGFGSNSIGRFSLVGVYHELIGKLICEKKYIINKGIKRVRRYNLEVVTKPISQENKVSNGNISNLPNESEIRSGRIRQPPFTYSHGYNDYRSLYFQSSDSAVSVSKRKKLNASLKGTAIKEGRPSVDQYSDSKNYFVGDPDDTDDYKSAFLDEDTGEIYEGGWYNGMRHGKGICLYSDGKMYEGQWVYGKECGKGQLLTGDRQVIYSGDWFDGLMHGQGAYYFSNGDQYTGDWKEGQRHGKGTYNCKSGCRYVGDFKENKRAGKGIFYWTDGSIYDGEWDNDMRHGRGVLNLASGFKYDGYWVHNFAEGRGVCNFVSGQEYQGGFKQGFREGRGSIKFSEGAEYEGRFKDDRIDGQGTLKVINTVPGPNNGEIFVPIQIQADIKRIHMKAGFGEETIH